MFPTSGPVTFRYANGAYIQAGTHFKDIDTQISGNLNVTWSQTWIRDRVSVVFVDFTASNIAYKTNSKSWSEFTISSQGSTEIQGPVYLTPEGLSSPKLMHFETEINSVPTIHSYFIDEDDFFSTTSDWTYDHTGYDLTPFETAGTNDWTAFESDFNVGSQPTYTNVPYLFSIDPQPNSVTDQVGYLQYDGDPYNGSDLINHLQNGSKIIDTNYGSFTTANGFFLNPDGNSLDVAYRNVFVRLKETDSTRIEGDITADIDFKVSSTGRASLIDGVNGTTRELFRINSSILETYSGPVISPLTGPTNISAGLSEPLSGPIGFSARLNSPLEGATNFILDIEVPSSGPDTFDYEILAPETGPLYIVKVWKHLPNTGPSSLATNTLEPKTGPDNFAQYEQGSWAKISVGPTQLAKLDLPLKGPYSIVPDVVQPSVGVESVSITDLPSEGPSGLSDQTVEPVQGPETFTYYYHAITEKVTNFEYELQRPKQGATNLEFEYLKRPKKGPISLDIYNRILTSSKPNKYKAFIYDTRSNALSGPFNENITAITHKDNSDELYAVTEDNRIIKSSTLDFQGTNFKKPEDPINVLQKFNLEEKGIVASKDGEFAYRGLYLNKPFDKPSKGYTLLNNPLYFKDCELAIAETHWMALGNETTRKQMHRADLAFHKNSYGHVWLYVENDEGQVSGQYKGLIDENIKVFVNLKGYRFRFKLFIATHPEYPWALREMNLGYLDGKTY